MADLGCVRFYNTIIGLEDCEEHLCDDDLTIEEKINRSKLIDISRRIVDQAERYNLEEEVC